RVADELEGEVLVDVGDREQVLEDPLESDVLALVRRGIRLEQRLEGAHLDVEEMGHVHALIELRERNLLQHFWHSFTRHEVIKNGGSPSTGAKCAGRRGK